jgi:hyperosmotically inducible periplasmic protein
MHHRLVLFRSLLLSLALALTLLPALPGPAAAQDPRLDDDTIQRVVENRLRQRGMDGDVRVSVEDGVVTLSGTVATLGHRTKAADLARGVDDVARIDNRLEVVRANVDNADLAREVGRRIVNDAFYGVFDWIEGEVQGSRVVLRGSVSEAWKKDHFADRIASLGGVTEVVNEIEVLPTSITDDRIRSSLARSIYGDVAFDRHGAGSTVPVHIVVKGGDVTLEGRVSTLVERRIAESAARSNPLVFDVENRIETP